MAIALAYSPMRSASSASVVPQTCKPDSIAVQQVLGVSNSDHYAGPELMSGGTCAWRTTDPTCFLRVLSIRRHVSGKDLAAVMRLRAHVKPFDRAPGVLGADAFYAHTDLGPGAAIAIERIYTARNDQSWVEGHPVRSAPTAHEGSSSLPPKPFLDSSGRRAFSRSDARLRRIEIGKVVGT